MKFTINPLTMTRALAKLGGIDKAISGPTKLRLVFSDSYISMSRGDREHLCEVGMPAVGMGDFTVSVEWLKFSNILKNGVLASDVALTYDVETATLHITQGTAIKIKVPKLLDDARTPYECAAPQEIEMLASQESFFKALKQASVFCQDKIVGRGKYSGAVVHGDRVIGASHEGAFIAHCAVAGSGIKASDIEPFGIPHNAVWTLLGLGQSDSLFLTISGPMTIPGKVRAVCFAGRLGDVEWLVKFAWSKPSQAFLGQDLHKAQAWPSCKWEADVIVGNLQTAISSAQSIQGKGDVWADLTAVSHNGILVRGAETTKTSEAKSSTGVEAFRGESFAPKDEKDRSALQVKRVALFNLLAGFEGGDIVTLGFDTAGSRVMIKHATEGHLAMLVYNLKE